MATTRKEKNGVVVTITDEHRGVQMPRWIIMSVAKDGLPVRFNSDESFASADEAFESVFRIVGV